MGSSPKVLITDAVEPQLHPQQTPEIRSRRKSILGTRVPRSTAHPPQPPNQKMVIYKTIYNYTKNHRILKY
jgi:hypothetical protein